MTRITLRIDQIVSDRPGLDRAALEAALRREVGQLVARDGTAALGKNSYRQHVQTGLPAGKSGLASRVATAAVRTVKP